MVARRVDQNAVNSVALRSPEIVMDLDRLGSLYPYRLSFMRALMRRIMTEKWRIDRRFFDLDEGGYGTAIYEIKTPKKIYSFVAFTQSIDSERRSDRVIADAWDMTVTLCEGAVDERRLSLFRINVPLQEKGRLDSRSIVLSRANKSVRNFEYVVNCLAAGQQPSWEKISKVGYLYRTTAVYGSGKFGMADWEKFASSYLDFARPFAAEMFVCFMIRQFSIELAEHIASLRAPETMTPMSIEMKRYIGIGNATGLGMAPYLINHPLLIDKWIEVRETALARVLAVVPDSAALNQFELLLKKVVRHLAEITTDNADQNSTNNDVRDDVGQIAGWFSSESASLSDWRLFANYVEQNFGTETQELMNTLLIELYPTKVDDLDDALDCEEDYPLLPEMPVQQLIDLIQEKYDWALAIDLNKTESQGVFWYRSEEKMEPRLGRRYEEPGDDREMLIGIARRVCECFEALSRFQPDDEKSTVAAFVVAHPEYRLITRRIQTMSKTTYGEIRTNLLKTDILPIHLLRCKLSFFGVSKFDPRSRLWVRNTMFQGAPLCEDIGAEYLDDWCFPVRETIVSN